MTTGKEKLLNETYEQFIKLSIDDLPIELTTAFVAENFMGYGTAIDEKLFSSSDYRDLLIRQREQAVGLDIKFEETPVFRKITVSEDAAIIVGEFVLSMLVDGSIHEIFMRLTTVMEFINGKWLAVHVHASKPDNTLGETDTWHINEWKRKNEELQKLVDEKTADLEAKNRELEIEGSLERVRAQAMGMTKPDDLLNICETLFKEFHTLGFSELRNTMINIHDDNKKTFLNYDYSDEIGKSITPLFYNIHPVIEKQIKQIRSANDAFSETVFKGEDLESWKEFRKSRGEKDDPRINNISALYYYFYSIGTSSIGISTFNSIDEEKLEVLKRFRNVFKLSYQRYKDIEQAEAQAREAKIELGLERVRARAMAMQSSNELSELVDTLFKELTKLDFALSWCIINIIDESSLSNTVWAANPNIDKAPDSYHMKFEDYPFHDAMMKGYKERETKYIYVLEGIEKKVYDEYLFKETEFRKVPEEAQAASRAMEKYVCSFTFCNFGGLQTVSDEPLSDSNLGILERFGKVFDLTYTRFNDLQKAEIQAREAQIELALERVRAKAMAMHSSKDLVETIGVFYRELKSLGVIPRRCGVALIEKETRMAEVSTMNTTEQGESVEVIGKIKMTGHPILENIFEHWILQKEYNTVLSGNQIKEYYQVLRPQISYPDYPHDAVQFGYYFMFKEGDVYAWTEKELKEEELKIFRRFTTVISLTYKRYKDLQKAEAQAREAQIEAALERVRSRTMGMQKSEELKEVIQVVYAQFVHLNILVEHTGFVIDYKARDDYDIWVADPLGVSLPGNNSIF